MSILQAALPFTPWDDPALARMPGIQPVQGPWWFADDAYAGQIAHRAALLRDKRDAVFAVDDSAQDATRAYLAAALVDLPPGFARDGDTVTCPDGRAVALDWDAPLETVNQIMQQDVAILQKRGTEHVLTAGLLCFPASWSLDEKFLRPLSTIHDPVDSYDNQMAARVQRLFDMARVGRPMWRANALMYHDAELHQPRRMTARRVPPVGKPAFLRSERQTILRIPDSDAVAFVIHTYVVPFARLTRAQQATCPLH